MVSSSAVTDDQARELCLMGQGGACCRYLVMGTGFMCAKTTMLKAQIDARAATMNAKGDNCPGIPAP